MTEAILVAVIALAVGLIAMSIVLVRHLSTLGKELRQSREDIRQTNEAIDARTGHVASQAANLAAMTQERLDSVEEQTQQMFSEVLALSQRGGPFDSPISRLTFAQSLDPTRFAEAAESAARTSISKMLSRHSGDGVQMTLQTMRITQQGAEMVVSMSKGGQTLLDRGLVKFPVHRGSGARLPQLLDARTGRVVEKLKEMPVTNITSKLASVTGAVVSAAHLIAGADLAKRMATLESKMDRLIALHRIDQLAKLQRVYRYARELALGGMDRHGMQEMWRLRGDLQELRSAWRQECTLKLGQIKDPSDAWFKNFFTRQRTLDKRIVTELSAGEAEIALMHYSLRLEHVLAVGSGTVNHFMDSQASETEELERLLALVREKSRLISGTSSDLSAEPVVTAMTQLVQTSRELSDLRPEVHAADVVAIEEKNLPISS